MAPARRRSWRPAAPPAAHQHHERADRQRPAVSRRSHSPSASTSATGGIDMSRSRGTNTGWDHERLKPRQHHRDPAPRPTASARPTARSSLRRARRTITTAIASSAASVTISSGVVIADAVEVRLQAGRGQRLQHLGLDLARRAAGPRTAGWSRGWWPARPAARSRPPPPPSPPPAAAPARRRRITSSSCTGTTSTATKLEYTAQRHEHHVGDPGQSPGRAGNAPRRPSDGDEGHERGAHERHHRRVAACVLRPVHQRQADRGQHPGNERDPADRTTAGRSSRSGPRWRSTPAPTRTGSPPARCRTPRSADAAPGSSPTCCRRRGRSRTTAPSRAGRRW